MISYLVVLVSQSAGSQLCVEIYTLQRWFEWEELNRLFEMCLNAIAITKTRLFKYILKILQPEPENFQIKNSDIFHIPAQNIDCGYSLDLL